MAATADAPCACFTFAAKQVSRKSTHESIINTFDFSENKGIKGTMDKVELGRITAPSGIRGEVRIRNYTDDPDRFSKLDSLYIGSSTEITEVENARTVSPSVSAVKLRGVDDRNAAEALRGKTVYIDAKDLPELPEGSYYVRDLIGLAVIDDDTSETVGTIKDVNQNGPQDIYIIDAGGREAMVPAVSEFVKKVDVQGGYVRIHFIEGMIEK